MKQAGKVRLALWMIWGRLRQCGKCLPYPQSFLRKALKLYIEMGHFHRENQGRKQDYSIPLQTRSRRGFSLAGSAHALPARLKPRLQIPWIADFGDCGFRGLRISGIADFGEFNCAELAAKS